VAVSSPKNAARLDLSSGLRNVKYFGASVIFASRKFATDQVHYLPATYDREDDAVAKKLVELRASFLEETSLDSLTAFHPLLFHVSEQAWLDWRKSNTEAFDGVSAETSLSYEVFTSLALQHALIEFGGRTQYVCSLISVHGLTPSSLFSAI
jgi:hypothetical protein